MPNTGVRSTDEFWDEYASRFGPPLTEQILLAGPHRFLRADRLSMKLGKKIRIDLRGLGSIGIDFFVPNYFTLRLRPVGPLKRLGRHHRRGQEDGRFSSG
jgi:hypothetical protein